MQSNSRQHQTKLLSRGGLQRRTSVRLTGPQRIIVMTVAALMIAAISIASQAIAGVDRSAPQSRQEASGQPTSQSLGTLEQSGAPVQVSTEREDASMQSDIHIQSQSSSSSQGVDATGVDVSVNGQDIPVPQNGSVHKQIADSNGQSVIDIQVGNSSDEGTSSSSSTVIIEQYSYSTGSETKKSGGSSRHPDRR